MQKFFSKTPGVSRRKILALMASGGAALTMASRSWAQPAKSDQSIIQPETRTDKSFIDRAFDMRQMATGFGDQPYGAVVVQGQHIIGQSWSRVLIDQDPTGHAEIAAIRDATRREQNRDLTGATLYSSSRPCPMCEAAAYWAGISALVYSIDAVRVGAPQLCASRHKVIPPMTEDEFLIAASANDTDRLLLGLLEGKAADTRDQQRRTALLIATYYNAVEAAQLLIQNGANVNAMDTLQDSPYLYAGAEGKLEILKLTVAAGADLSSVNRYGGTALIPAAHHGHVDVVKYLLTTEINIDHINYLGWTALLEAVILGDGGPVYQNIIKLLIDAGADKTIADKNGITPLEHAENRRFSKIVGLLR